MDFDEQNLVTGFAHFSFMPPTPYLVPIHLLDPLKKRSWSISPDISSADFSGIHDEFFQEQFLRLETHLSELGRGAMT